MRLLLDEHFADAIADQLRSMGFDGVTVSELGLKGAGDEQLLELAAGQKRALLTNDVGDFAGLHVEWMASGRTHYGLLFTGSTSMPRSRLTIGRYVTVLSDLMAAHPGDDELVNQIRWPR